MPATIAAHPVPADEFTDVQWALMDQVRDALEAGPDEGLTPSGVARKVKATTDEVRPLLDYMVEHQVAYTAGNGAWRRFHAGRA